ncbi:MAG: CoA-binding protein [Ignavibacteria bacterium]|nr:CoA-binding protein [Ignavibacteria bacterium]
MTTDEVLNKYKKIAVLGFSQNSLRPSNHITIYLQNAGYTVYGVNPGLAGREVDGIQCYGSLSEIKDEVEIVNVFRNARYLPEIIDEVLALPYKPKVIWTQLEVVNADAKAKAIAAGIDYVEDKCIYVEHKLNPNVKK